MVLQRSLPLQVDQPQPLPALLVQYNECCMPPAPVVVAAGNANAVAAAVIAGAPQGFFTDKEADAKARGVKLPTAADREAEFRAFTAAIDEELKVQVSACVLARGGLGLGRLWVRLHDVATGPTRRWQCEVLHGPQAGKVWHGV